MQMLDDLLCVIAVVDQDAVPGGVDAGCLCYLVHSREEFPEQIGGHVVVEVDEVPSWNDQHMYRHLR